MKAKLRFDEESGTLMARIEKCPKQDGTFIDIEWKVGELGTPFMGITISDEAIRAMDGQEMEVKDPEKLWKIQKDNQMSMGCKVLMPGRSVGKSSNFDGKIIELIPRSPGFKFRFHRGGYQDSMSTCVTLDSVADLEKLVSETYGLDTPLTFKFNSMGLDRRNGWKTYLVTCNKQDLPVGYTNSIPAGEPVHYPSAPPTPETCPNCGAKYSGGSTAPGDAMKPDLRVFYICGASISMQLRPDNKLLMLKNCSKLPESVKRYQYENGKWVDIEEWGKPAFMSAYQRMKVRECIGLLSSMIRGGESHSDVSKEAVRKAFEYLNGEGS